MVEVSFTCPDKKEYEKVCQLIKSEVSFSEKEFSERSDFEGYLCIEENYSGSIGMPQEAQSLALSIIDCSPETIFDISGSTITDHSNMDFEFEYNGKVCTYSGTDWYWYIWLGNYSTLEECEENEIGDWQFYPDEESEQHRRESLRAVFAEAKRLDELYYNEYTYEYSVNPPEKSKPQIMMWTGLPDGADEKTTCMFCHKKIHDGEGIRKQIPAPGAPACLICPDCLKAYDFSDWEDVKDE